MDPGGLIMIHGRPNYIDSPRILAEYDNRDWTNGCIAVKNAEMDEIWTAVRDGTPIRILPLGSPASPAECRKAPRPCGRVLKMAVRIPKGHDIPAQGRSLGGT